MQAIILKAYYCNTEELVMDIIQLEMYPDTFI